MHLRNLITTKYGKEFVTSAMELRPDSSVNRTIIEKLSVKAPSAESKLKVLKAIAQEYNLEWDSSNTESEFNKKYQDLQEEPESLLDDSGHLRTLAFLYGSKGMCSKALAIWRILARNYSTGLWKDSTDLSETDSLQTLVDKKSGEEIAAIEASKILQASSDQDLVQEHLGWVADIDQERAIAILTSEMRENQLSPGI